MSAGGSKGFKILRILPILAVPSNGPPAQSACIPSGYLQCVGHSRTKLNGLPAGYVKNPVKNRPALSAPSHSGRSRPKPSDRALCSEAAPSVARCCSIGYWSVRKLRRAPGVAANTEGSTADQPAQAQATDLDIPPTRPCLPTIFPGHILILPPHAVKLNERRVHHLFPGSHFSGGDARVGTIAAF